jgi:RNA polymerase sigma-70 factor (ECF subfamily)
MTPEVSRDLIVRARRGDREAFRLLLDSLASFTFALAWRMTGNAADAEDLSQDIFLRLHRNLDRCDPARPFTPWFRTLATNVCLNHRKQARAHPSASLDAAEGRELSAPDDPPPGEFDGRLRQFLQELPAEYRMVLTWLYFQEMSVAEIAAAMQIPTGTVKTWLFRGREELKNKLKPYVSSPL